MEHSLSLFLIMEPRGVMTLLLCEDVEPMLELSQPRLLSSSSSVTVPNRKSLLLSGDQVIF